MIQRHIGDELLAHGWHAAAIADPHNPGSAWILTDPRRRVKVRMSTDFAAPCASITASRLSSSPQINLPWSTVIDFAEATAILAAVFAAASTGDSRPGTTREHRAIVRALAASGMSPDASRLRRAFTGSCTWQTSDQRARATWRSPSQADNGGWLITAPTLQATTTAAVPAAVLAALIDAAVTWNRQESSS
jgi:hypothetical protein